MIRLLITASRGPAECRIAVANTLAAMAREAEASGLWLDVAAAPAPDGHGPASAIAAVSGPGAEVFARSWSGSIQWICKSPLRSRHKRKNWFVGAIALPAAVVQPAALDPREVRFEAFRAGGPGGQHQNTTDSAVRAVHVPTGLADVARDGRSQHRNKAAALERLALLLRLSQDVAATADQQTVHAAHDRLERGNPVRRFRGRAFEAV